MFGIPFTIIRECEMGGVIETVYLRTYRRGGKGDEMRKCLKAYHAATIGQSRAAGRIPVLLGQAAKVAQENDSLAMLEKLAEDQEKIISESVGCSAEALVAAEQIAELALQENYAEKTTEIMDKLTDRELHAIVGTIEMGEMPKDFFQFVEAWKKAITTGRFGDTPEQSSSKPGSPGSTLKKAE